MIIRQGADTLTPVYCELGGKTPIIVFEDADPERALDAAVFMIYPLKGERCTSCSRVLIQESVRGIRGPTDKAREKYPCGSSARP